MDAKEKEAFYRIRDICQEVAKGEYSSLQELKKMTIARGYPPPIAQLAASLCDMVLKIHRHEHALEEKINELQAVQKELKKSRDLLKEKNLSLRDKVHTLEINIDQIKKNREVAQIAQSAFFKEIKHKASRRKKNEPKK